MLHQHDKPTVPTAVLTAAPLSPVLDPHPPVSESGGKTDQSYSYAALQGQPDATERHSTND